MKTMNVAIAISVITILIIIGISTGCKNERSDNMPVISPERSDELALGLDGSLVDANTRFAFNIFERLASEDAGQNIFISPLSMLLAIAMTYNGAAGETGLAMADAMEFSGMDMEELNQGFSDLMASVLNADDDIEISIANSIWQRADFDAREEFIDINKKYYSSEVKKLNFSDPGSVDIINNWISDATRKKIEKMLDEIPPDIIMYLINAIYFKGDWTYPFEESSTSEAEFYLAGGDVKKVQMMRMHEYFDYIKGDGYAAVRLPYGQEKFAMYILLPGEGIDIDSIVNNMDQTKWQQMIGNFEDTDIRLSMPKYKMEYGVKLLNDVLSDMGMGIAFGPEADFSNIADGIFISRIMHKAIIEVNERGSEAAAVTVTEMAESAMPVDEVVEFNVNRPFIFTISDDRTGSILFMGKVMDPQD